MASASEEDVQVVNETGHPSSNKKPCRACMDFKTWSKLQTQKSQSKSVSNNTAPTISNIDLKQQQPPSDCPVDRDELGRATWTYLHTMAAYYPDSPTLTQQKEMSVMMRTFSKYYPCDDCSQHMREWMTTNPPATRDRRTLSHWMCNMHNEVNERLGKPVFDCSKVDERWLDGWKDGSCD